MKKILFVLILSSVSVVQGQPAGFNYEESGVPDYCLPAVLTLLDGTRVETKSSQLKYDFRAERWGFRFIGVKERSFDVCFLVCYSPSGIHICVWDGTRFSKTGKIGNVFGGHIAVAGTCKVGWQQSLNIILRERFPGEVVAFLPWPQQDLAASGAMETSELRGV